MSNATIRPLSDIQHSLISGSNELALQIADLRAGAMTLAEQLTAALAVGHAGNLAEAAVLVGAVRDALIEATR